MDDKIFNPELQANLRDSLNYLTEINRTVQKFKNGQITEDDLVNFLKKRSEEYGYIANFEHTFEVMEKTKEIFADKAPI